MEKLTVFTPTYNRKHTIGRTFDSLMGQSSLDFRWLIIDDGSSDGTCEWVKSLGRIITDSGPRFDWMGRIVSEAGHDYFTIEIDRLGKTPLMVDYVYKPNGGLYTGYNVAYALIRTELCVCIDSDDYMPYDAVEKILKIWAEHEKDKSKFGGIVGLDFNVVDHQPIGGFFPERIDSAFFQDLHHGGDTKQVMRTELMRQVAPQIGFEGEKDFNPYYMLMQICDKYPLIVINENLCWVEYQTSGDSMSAGIWRQYIRSPRSYAKYRITQIQMEHGNSISSRIRLNIHYVSACILSHDRMWLKKSPSKVMSFFVAPLGWILSLVIRYKNRK